MRSVARDACLASSFHHVHTCLLHILCHHSQQYYELPKYGHDLVLCAANSVIIDGYILWMELVIQKLSQEEVQRGPALLLQYVTQVWCNSVWGLHNDVQCMQYLSRITNQDTEGCHWMVASLQEASLHYVVCHLLGEKCVFHNVQQVHGATLQLQACVHHAPQQALHACEVSLQNIRLLPSHVYGTVADKSSSVNCIKEKRNSFLSYMKYATVNLSWILESKMWTEAAYRTWSLLNFCTCSFQSWWSLMICFYFIRIYDKYIF